MPTDTKIIIASEATHWYKKDGTPCYEIENKSKPGEMRPVTLRDAKKLGLVPSVTAVLSILAKPGLEAWKSNQVLLSAATSPYKRSEMSADEWSKKVLVDAQEQAEQARAKGTGIHAAIERELSTVIVGEYREFSFPVFELLEKLGLHRKGIVEMSFAHPLGFDGKVDFYNLELIIDFKTKEFTQKDLDEGKKLAWDEHCWQLSGYRLGLQMPGAICQNWFISTTAPGLIHIHEWKEIEISKGIDVFIKTLDLWKLLKL